MPPIIGAAMRFITSAPTPADHMIGKSPINITELACDRGRGGPAHATFADGRGDCVDAEARTG